MDDLDASKCSLKVKDKRLGIKIASELMNSRSFKDHHQNSASNKSITKCQRHKSYSTAAPAEASSKSFHKSETDT